MIKLDGHIHTYPKSYCSTTSPQAAVEAAIKAGLDAIVFTEHDCAWGSDEIERVRRYADGRLIVLSGMEVSCREGHFLLFGPVDYAALSVGMPVEDLIRLARLAGAAVIAAHPFRFDERQGYDCYGFDIDGVEVNSVNTSSRAHVLAEELASKKNLFRFTASDAHGVNYIGAYHTEFPDHVKNEEDVAAFILGFRAKGTGQTKS
jgi:hypothetical protein